jgi:predicted DNA-binding WGR domain protein
MPFQRWERDRRYYEARLTPDLFGSICLVLTFGGIGTRLGRSMTLPFPTEAEASAAFAAVARRRRARGYAPREIAA